MRVILENLVKRYESDWIVKNLDYTFEEGSKTAVIGPNGSGKSTLLRLIMGMELANKGKVTYQKNGKELDSDIWYKYISFCSPAQQLIEEFTLEEFLSFHFKFKTPIKDESRASILEKMYLENSKNKLIKNFSSGMKQRLKLGIALFTQSEVILLDEPTTNLDEKGMNWYHEQIINTLGNRSIIISSNQTNEYTFCNEYLNLSDFKP